MKFSGKRINLAALVGIIGILALSSLAWACSPQSRLFGIAPLAGPPATEVKMQGEGVQPGTPVEIRWNSPSGAKLGQALAGPDGTFAVVVTIPEADPDVYSLLAVPAGNTTGLARNAFEVTEPAITGRAAGRGIEVDASSDLWSGLSGRGSPAVAPTSVQPASSPTTSSALMVGMGLSAIGSIALLGAIGMQVRRKASQFPA